MSASDLFERLKKEPVEDVSGDLAIMVYSLLVLTHCSLDEDRDVGVHQADAIRRVAALAAELQGLLIDGVEGLSQGAKRGMWRPKTAA